MYQGLKVTSPAKTLTNNNYSILDLFLVMNAVLIKTAVRQKQNQVIVYVGVSFQVGIPDFVPSFTILRKVRCSTLIRQTKNVVYHVTACSSDHATQHLKDIIFGYS